MKINRYMHYIPIASMSLSALIAGCNYHTNTDEAVQNSFNNPQRITYEVIDDLLNEADSTTTRGVAPKEYQSKKSYSLGSRNKILVKQANEARERIKSISRLTDWEKDEIRDQARQERQREYEEWLDTQPDSVKFRDHAVQEVNSMTFHPDYRYGGTGESGTYGRWVEENWSKAKRDSTINRLIREYREEARQKVVADSIRKSHLSRGESEYTVEIRAKSSN